MTITRNASAPRATWTTDTAAGTTGGVQSRLAALAPFLPLVALAISALIFGISQGITQGLLSFFYTYLWELPSSALLLIPPTAPHTAGGLLGSTMIAP